jgi:hypothetical protein
VFIGRDLDREALVAGLDDCLATDDERAALHTRGFLSPRGAVGV